MDSNHRNGKLIELVGSPAFEEAFRVEVRRRRWAVALVTLSISLLGFWLMLDVTGSGGWTPLKMAAPTSSVPGKETWLHQVFDAFQEEMRSFFGWAVPYSLEDSAFVETGKQRFLPF
jgi:hypothetical protein